MAGAAGGVTRGYSGFSRLLHWLTVLLIAGVFGVTYFWDDPGRQYLFTVHVSFGVTILALTLIRLAQWLFIPRPAPLPVPRLQVLAAHATHGLLYLLLLVQPMLGWASEMLDGHGVDFYGLFTIPAFLPVNHALGETLIGIHTTLPTIILAVIAVHIGAALYHHFIVKDRTLVRMIWSD